MRSRLRFIIALAVAAGLGGWLLYAAIGGATATYSGPGEIVAGKTYKLNGDVASAVPADAVARARSEAGLRFTVADKADPAKRLGVVYHGTVPDQFKTGREVVVTGRLEGAAFVAERDSLLTKCPSKFTAAEDGAPPR
jgi:cytochrome c-type biogenesis protein CcmE